MSGEPGKALTFLRYRYPLENKYFLAVISGFVSFPVNIIKQNLVLLLRYKIVFKNKTFRATNDKLQYGN